MDSQTHTQLVGFLRDELNARRIRRAPAPRQIEEWTANRRRFLLRSGPRGQCEVFYRVEPWETQGMTRAFLEQLVYPGGRVEALLGIDFPTGEEATEKEIK